MAKGSSLGRWLQLKSIFEISSLYEAGEYLREMMNEDNLLLFPAPGSPLWSEMIDVPAWFYKYLTGNQCDPVSILKAAKDLRKRRIKKTKKRLQVGEVVMKKMSVRMINLFANKYYFRYV